MQRIQWPLFFLTEVKLQVALLVWASGSWTQAHCYYYIPVRKGVLKGTEAVLIDEVATYILLRLLFMLFFVLFHNPTNCFMFSNGISHNQTLLIPSHSVLTTGTSFQPFSCFCFSLLPLPPATMLCSLICEFTHTFSDKGVRLEWKFHHNFTFYNFFLRNTFFQLNYLRKTLVSCVLFLLYCCIG